MPRQLRPLGQGPLLSFVTLQTAITGPLATPGEMCHVSKRSTANFTEVRNGGSKTFNQALPDMLGRRFPMFCQPSVLENRNIDIAGCSATFNGGEASSSVRRTIQPIPRLFAVITGRGMVVELRVHWRAEGQHADSGWDIWRSMTLGLCGVEEHAPAEVAEIRSMVGPPGVQRRRVAKGPAGVAAQPSAPQQASA
ncbi:hypothetical protein CONLIGDRAFT_649939 [Coniochaeta ligniaria NRRL 30616]|uniref:Uncharacterized protein n=1 Tax=Coniochaeta ligniaria NRRL 30616 TaxID=1408157 RepID=A0A1J7I6P3_9PEZI|nr:hypothetical protein CONLIGDRAFT_649939 [Coniochaeta ligniaria NRRL 30616]